jgi:hypothetical protein
MQALLLNLRMSIRSLRKSPGFTLTALLTIALGIGAITSVFSVVNTVLLKPFAFPDPGQLAVLREVVGTHSQASIAPDNYRHYLRLKKDAKTIEDAAIFHQRGISVSPSGDQPRIVGAVTASPNLLRVLGVKPLFGRDFVAQDAEKGAAKASPPRLLVCCRRACAFRRLPWRRRSRFRKLGEDWRLRSSHP